MLAVQYPQIGRSPVEYRCIQPAHSSNDGCEIPGVDGHAPRHPAVHLTLVVGARLLSRSGAQTKLPQIEIKGIACVVQINTAQRKIDADRIGPQNRQASTHQ